MIIPGSPGITLSKNTQKAGNVNRFPQNPESGPPIPEQIYNPSWFQISKIGGFSLPMGSCRTDQTMNYVAHR
jgi:hypothetical protein